MEFGLITLNGSNNVYCGALHTYIGNQTQSTTTGSTNLYQKSDITWSCCGSGNYNGRETVFWAIDNFYQIGCSGDVKNITVDNLARIIMKHKNKSYTEAKNIVNDVIKNNKDIYSVQQCVLWSLTNNHDQRQNFSNNMNILYESLSAEAENNRGYKGNGNNKPTITTNSAKVNKNGVIGPFSITGGPYTISVISKVGNSNVGNKLYKDANCTNAISSIDNYNGNFYVKLNNTSFTAGTKYNISVNFSGKYLKTVDAKYWTTTNKYLNNPTYNPEGQGAQPLISFSKGTADYSGSFSGSYSEKENGKYNLRITKKATTGGSGTATFNIKQYLSGSTNVTKEFNPVLTAGSGINTLAGNITISDTKSDTYIIKETSTTGNLAIGFTDTLKIVVNKECEDNLKYKFKSYDIYINNKRVFNSELTSGCSTGNIKIDIDHTNGYITVTFTNPSITGSYQMSYVKKSTQSTTSIDDVSDAVPGAIFGVTTKLNGSSTGSKTNITTEEGKAKTVTQTISNTTKDDVYEITEIEAPSGYLKSTVLENCYIRLTVKKGTENGKYIVEKVSAELVTKALDYVIASSDLEKDKEFEFKVANSTSSVEGLRLKFTSDKVTVELRDPPVLPFKFSIQKEANEDNQKFLQETDMKILRTVVNETSKQEVSEQEIHNGTFEDGEAKFIYTEENVSKGYKYYYDIYENSAAPGYKNILGDKLFLRVTVTMSDSGSLSANIEVKGVNGYNPTQAEKDEVMKYIDNPFVNSDIRTISLNIKNPKDTIPVNLQLFKHQLDNKSSPVKDAIYSVKEIDENGNKISDLPGLTTNITSKTIANITEGEIGKSYYYEVTEDTVPVNYVNVISGVRVKLEINAEGKVISSITQIKQKDSDVWEAYNNTFERYISISDPDENNNIILYMANSVKFDFTLYKKNYASNTDLEQAEKFDGTAIFKIEQVIGNQTKEIFNGTLEDAQTFFNEIEAAANTTYIYRVTETSVSDDFYDTLVNVPIILKIRTDANGKVKDEASAGSNWSFENESSFTKTQLELMNSLVDLKIGENNQVNLYIANMPKNYYSLQLVKVDKNGNPIKSKNAKFEVGMETNNQAGEGIPTSEEETKNGILNIASGCIIDPGYTHTYTIIETEEPLGYTKLEGTVQLVAKFTDDGELLNENISLKYTNADGIEETVEGLTFVYDDNSKIPTIQVFIPNDSKLIEFELVKEDLKGNKITVEEDSNGNIDGAHFNISRLIVTQVPDTTTNVTDSHFFEGTVINDVLEDGTVNDIVPAFTNLHYLYQIQETSPKSGYVNIFDRYFMNLDIVTDDEAKISSVDYQIIDILNHGNNATNTFKEKYGDFVELKVNDTKDKVTILIKNTRWI